MHCVPRLDLKLSRTHVITQSLALSTAVLQRREGKQRAPTHRSDFVKLQTLLTTRFAAGAAAIQLVWSKDILTEIANLGTDLP